MTGDARFGYSRSTMRRHLRASTLVDVLVTLAVFLALGAMLTVWGRKTRAASQLSASMSNLEHIASLSASYNADNQDQAPALSWVQGVAPDSQFPDLIQQTVAGSAAGASSAQAVDIIRRRSRQASFPVQDSWAPHFMYAHLVLMDYAARDLPSLDFISPADAPRLSLARAEVQGDRSAYSSSYEMSVWFGQMERLNAARQFGGWTSAGTHNQFTTGAAGVVGFFRPRRMSEVWYPAQKAYFFDRNERHFQARPMWFAEVGARPLVLAADGHCSARETSRLTMGFDPALPFRGLPLQYIYRPNAPLDPVHPSFAEFTCLGLLRWTRGGLEGRDFDGADIDTSAW